MRRRQALRVAAGALFGVPVLASSKPLAFQALTAPGPLAQIAAGGPTGLLGMSANGALFVLPLQQGGVALRLAEELDAGTPVAAGHGRIAARRRDGALWVLEGERVAVSAERNLAPAAGLLILPLAVIAVAMDAKGHRAVRLEPSVSATWSVVARSDMAVLPDARPLQADLDGLSDGGHVVVLAGPDSERYTHGVLGDAVEATRIVLLERHSLRMMRELVLEAPHVFEDIAPRKVAMRPGLLREGLLTVQSGPQGGQLLLVEADPSAPRLLRIGARGPALGTANRWLSPITDGRHWLAVHTPHIGGALHVYGQDGPRLLAHRVRGEVSNHRIGSRLLDMSAWLSQRLLLPDQSGRRLLVLDAASDWRLVSEHPLPSRVAAMISLEASGRVAVLLDDGNVMLGSVAG